MFRCIIKGNRQRVAGVRHRVPLASRTVHFAGYDIVIENEVGSIRSGVDKDGIPWKSVIQYPYGYFKGVPGVDGDELDVTLGPNEQSEKIWIIHARKSGDGDYDEDKCYLGFDNKESVIAAFYAQYDIPERYMGPINEYSIQQFKIHLKDIKQRKHSKRIGYGKEVATASSQLHHSEGIPVVTTRVSKFRVTIKGC